MPVRVMHIRHMRVTMNRAAMPVRMGVRLARRFAGGMFVPVMLVMHMAVIVLDRFVHMLVLMVLAEVQPDPCPHQHRGDKELA